MYFDASLEELLNEGGSAAVSRLLHRRRQRGRYGVGFSVSPTPRNISLWQVASSVRVTFCNHVRGVGENPVYNTVLNSISLQSLTNRLPRIKFSLNVDHHCIGVPLDGLMH